MMVTKEELQLTKLVKALNASDDTLRLHMGEMTAQELRTVRAAFNWVLAQIYPNEIK